MKLTNDLWKPPFRISIRGQLTALVSAVSIISLVILAITTGVYFSSNYKDLRSGRLYIAAQLKSSQIDQTLNYLYFQCYYLSTRDNLQSALINYAAGNKSAANWDSSRAMVEKFLSSSDLFYIARVYDYNFNVIVNATNNGTGDLVPMDIVNQLLPLSTDEPLPSSLQTTGLLTDPVANGTTFLMSMSLPIFANPSIILSDTRLYGYLTVIMSAEGLKSVFNDTSALEKSSVAVVSAKYQNTTKLEQFHFILPWFDIDSQIASETYPIKNNSFLYSAFVDGKGGSVKKTNFFHPKHVALGYSPCTFLFANWIAIVSQPESVFLSPSTKLKKIISGTVVGIAVFVCLVTLPLSHWAVKPIVRLQKATELVSEGKELRPPSHHFDLSSGKNYGKKLRESVDFHLAGSFSLFSGDKNSSSEEVIPRNSGSIKTGDSESDSSSSRKYRTVTNLTRARIPLYGRFMHDELSELTETFNTMTDALDQHYALLEDRVRARTKQLEAAKIKAEAANEAKTVFIANISHELRTPLNGILGMTAISMEETDLAKIRENLKLIFRSGELLLHILTELLTFSKNVLQRTNLEERNFCITDVAVQIKSIFGKVAKDQRVNFSIVLTPHRIRKMVLWGDSNRIIQIVMNLVSNALKFTPIDGKVSVRIKLLGNYDDERSKEAKYNKVFIEKGTELPVSSKGLKKTEGKKIFEVDNNELTTDSSSPILNEKDLISSASNADISSSKSFSTDEKTQTKIIEVNHIDSSDQNFNDSEIFSMVSTSTSSYNDTILIRQLQKNPALDDDNEHLGSEVEDPKTWVFAIEVEDTGPGIEPHLQEAVFKPFVQGDQALSRQYGGTGLGLSICRQLATMMKGTMVVESEVGVGSKFIFTVPLKQTRELGLDQLTKFTGTTSSDNINISKRIDFSSKQSNKNVSKKRIGTETKTVDVEEGSISRDASSNFSNSKFNRPFLQSTGTAISSKNVPTISTTKELESDGKKKPEFNSSVRILVAEDNHVNQEVIRRMLNLEGIDYIDLACDGQDAFDKVKSLHENSETYDIVFMDVQMPKVDGLVSTKMIRNDLMYEGTIVALTAFANEENIKECLDAGMTDFLAKPIRRPKLKEILNQYIHSKE